jgi:hypothetical protein
MARFEGSRDYRKPAREAMQAPPRRRAESPGQEVIRDPGPRGVAMQP